MIQTHLINKAMMRPLLILGVEKRLFFCNGLLSFALIISTHLQIPICLTGVVFFALTHFILRQVTQYDPYFGLLFKRSTRYMVQSYFPDKSHPMVNTYGRVHSVSW